MEITQINIPDIPVWKSIVKSTPIIANTTGVIGDYLTKNWLWILAVIILIGIGIFMFFTSSKPKVDKLPVIEETIPVSKPISNNPQTPFSNV